MAKELDRAYAAYESAKDILNDIDSLVHQTDWSRLVGHIDVARGEITGYLDDLTVIIESYEKQGTCR